MKFRRILEYICFLNSYIKYCRLSFQYGFNIPSIFRIQTAFGERGAVYVVDKHTFFSASWAARTLKKISPKMHYDISGDTTFLATVSAFIPVKSYDFRNIAVKSDRIEFCRGDLTKLPFETASINSLSCLHVVEHVGLGRYGDPIDPLGSEKAFSELSRVISPGGYLLLTIPLGIPDTHFHVTRVFDKDQILEKFENFKLCNFSFVVDNDNKIIEDASNDFVRQSHYGLGCFWFEKFKRCVDD